MTMNEYWTVQESPHRQYLIKRVRYLWTVSCGPSRVWLVLQVTGVGLQSFVFPQSLGLSDLHLFESRVVQLPGMVSRALIPALGRLKQEDRHESEASLSYAVRLCLK